MMRFLSRFYFRFYFDDIPELGHLPYEEAMRVLREAQHAAYEEQINDHRSWWYALAFWPAAIIFGALFMSGHKALAMLLYAVAAVVMVIAFKNRGPSSVVGPHIRRILEERKAFARS